MSSASPTHSYHDVALFASCCGTLPLMTIVPYFLFSPVPSSRMESCFTPCWEGKVRELIKTEQSGSLGFGALSGNTALLLCYGPPPPLQDFFGLADTTRALALLIPSILPFSRRMCSQEIPADTFPPPPTLTLRPGASPSWPAQKGPHNILCLGLREWGRSEYPCTVVVLGAAASPRLLMTTFSDLQNGGLGLDFACCNSGFGIHERKSFFLWNGLFFPS